MTTHLTSGNTYISIFTYFSYINTQQHKEGKQQQQQNPEVQIPTWICIKLYKANNISNLKNHFLKRL